MPAQTCNIQVRKLQRELLGFTKILLISIIIFQNVCELFLHCRPNTILPTELHGFVHNVHNRQKPSCRNINKDVLIFMQHPLQQLLCLGLELKTCCVYVKLYETKQKAHSRLFACHHLGLWTPLRITPNRITN